MNFGKYFINVCLLLAAILLLIKGFSDLADSSDKLTDLIPEKGILVTMQDSSVEFMDNKRPAVIFTLHGDTAHYWASRMIDYIHHHLHPGDHHSEILHLISIEDNYTIIDFAKNQHDAKLFFWVFPLTSLLILAWLLYRISGRKSMFVLES